MPNIRSSLSVPVVASFDWNFFARYRISCDRLL